jgi:hypothetical protein
MGRDQKKLEKRKAREASKKQKLSTDRAKLVVKRQEKKSEHLQDKAMRKAVREQMRIETEVEQMLGKLDPETREKLEHNIEILKALEKEYNKEQAERKSKNDQLEDQGHQTFQEKLDALVFLNQREGEGTFADDPDVVVSAELQESASEELPVFQRQFQEADAETNHNYRKPETILSSPKES